MCSQDHGALPERAVALIAYEVLQVRTCGTDNRSWAAPAAAVLLLLYSSCHTQQRTN